MKRWFLIFMRYDAWIDLHCARLSGNKQIQAYAITKIAEIDKELDHLAVQH